VHNAFDITVIVSIYEQTECLPLLLKSLLEQRYTGRWELLLCDDGSVSDYRPLLDVENNPMCDVRYLWQPHRGRGVCSSRNNGIRCARGELLVFVDADGFVPDDFLFTHVRAHTKGNSVYCGSRRLLFVQKAKQLYETPIASLVEQYNKDVRDIRRWQERVFFHSPHRACISCNMSVPRAANVYFDESLRGWGCEDVELAYRLWKSGGCAITIDPVSFVYSIETCDPEQYNSVRPTRHEDIVKCLRDILYIRSTYGDHDFMFLLDLCKRFELEHTTDEWRQIPFRDARNRSFTASLQAAEEWFLRNAARARETRPPGRKG
jgi:glycosyltransferase involved in cell wall biosynthesis